MRLNGAALASGEELRSRLAALVFTPERLAVVKGGPIVRRAYLDRMLGRVFPGRAELSPTYGRARGAAKCRRFAGCAPASLGRDAVEPWTAQVAALGTELDAARSELALLLGAGVLGASPSRSACTEALLTYEVPASPSRSWTSGSAATSSERTTGAGPHLRDARSRAGGRELRGFGSQGEQRTAVLALVLAEAELLAERRGEPPLLLLDDVFSELDTERAGGACSPAAGGRADA